LERQGFSLPEALVKAAITEAKAQGQRDLAREPWWQIGQAAGGVSW